MPDPVSPEETARRFAIVAFSPPPEHTAYRRTFNELLACRRSFVARAAQATLSAQLPVAWRNGWQPSELYRQVRRATNATGARLTLGLIAHDHHQRDPATLDRRWTAQVDALRVPACTDADWIVHWDEQRNLDTETFVILLVKLVRAVAALHPIAVLIPPPGSMAGSTAGTSEFTDLHTPLDDPMLQRVRALLAKAESTEFDAEAEAFTAKAQELMARYSIDAAMLSARTTRSDHPITIRIAIDDPYADAKSLLCQIVAAHSRCRAVRTVNYGFSTVVGFASDIAATEILFTSLLVQAQTALRAASLASGSGARTRSASFRSTFLLAYADRVGERLDAINAQVTRAAEADIGAALVPVLAARSAAVDEALASQFASINTSKPRGGHDAAGWASGRLAADRAQLNLGDLHHRPRPGGSAALTSRARTA